MRKVHAQQQPDAGSLSRRPRSALPNQPSTISSHPTKVSTFHMIANSSAAVQHTKLLTDTYTGWISAYEAMLSRASKAPWVVLAVVLTWSKRVAKSPTGVYDLEMASATCGKCGKCEMCEQAI